MIGRISKRNMMPLNPILEVELFNVWASTLWDPFLIHLATNTSWGLWIMYPNGLKPSLVRQITTKLLSNS